MCFLITLLWLNHHHYHLCSMFCWSKSTCYISIFNKSSQYELKFHCYNLQARQQNMTCHQSVTKECFKFFEFETSQSIIHWLRQTFFKAQISFDLCWLLRKQTTNSQWFVSSKKSYQNKETIGRHWFIIINKTVLRSQVWGRRWLGCLLLYWWYYYHFLTYPGSSMVSD